ncbi:MAG: hypothetical protein B6D61_11635 [Bacteroidetes bacterium 4484_249]|nr:MAG: hypothetical protein B6D61_11635 [Bacteroidetes bacterium 4484_249]
MNYRRVKYLISFCFLLFPFFVSSQGKIIAHRGASSIAPENTIAAFTKAIETCADFIEVDIRLSKEDSIMVIHDETLDRTTNGSGNVRQFNFQQLRELSAGYSKKFNSGFTNEKIPTLFEVLSLAKGKVKVCIDIKNTSETPVLELIEKLSMKNDVYLMSYNVEKLKRIKAGDPQIKTVLLKNTLTSIDLEIANEAGADGVSSSYLSPVWLAGKAHEKGLEFWIGIISDPAKAESLFNQNVDAIITNYPQLMTMNTGKEIFVSPNPFCEYVTIEFINPENVQEVYIINTKGSIIRKFGSPFANPLIWQPGNNIKKGLFLIYIIKDEKITFEKILYY